MATVKQAHRSRGRWQLGHFQSRWSLFDRAHQTFGELAPKIRILTSTRDTTRLRPRWRTPHSFASFHWKKQLHHSIHNNTNNNDASETAQDDPFHANKWREIKRDAAASARKLQNHSLFHCGSLCFIRHYAAQWSRSTPMDAHVWICGTRFHLCRHESCYSERILGRRNDCLWSMDNGVAPWILCMGTNGNAHHYGKYEGRRTSHWIYKRILGFGIVWNCFGKSILSTKSSEECECSWWCCGATKGGQCLLTVSYWVVLVNGFPLKRIVLETAGWMEKFAVKTERRKS